MNEFERKLRRQPFRQIPGEWRDEILAECDSAGTPRFEAAATWLDWLWPSPMAWGALAAIWLVCFALDAGGVPHALPPPPLASQNVSLRTAATPLFAFQPGRDFDALLAATR